MLSRLTAGQRDGRWRRQVDNVAELRVRNSAASLHFLSRVKMRD